MTELVTFFFILVYVYSTADDAIDGENYSLIRPSLIRQLKGILDQYPDDGHILKVGLTLDKLYLLANQNFRL